MGHLDLVLGIYLRFACLPVGREFVILKFIYKVPLLLKQSWR
jgi:hypothetical protein